MPENNAGSAYIKCVSLSLELQAQIGKTWNVINSELNAFIRMDEPGAFERAQKILNRLRKIQKEKGTHAPPPFDESQPPPTW